MFSFCLFQGEVGDIGHPGAVGAPGAAVCVICSIIILKRNITIIFRDLKALVDLLDPQVKLVNKEMLDLLVPKAYLDLMVIL